MPKVLIAPEMYCQQEDGEFAQLLSEAGFEVGFAERPPITGEQDLVEALQGFSAVIAGGEPYTDPVLASLPELRVIARAGVGYDTVDLEAATRHGKVVTVTPTANHDAVAEHAVALILGVARDLLRLDRGIRGGVYTKESLVPLRGKTLGIAGLGRIGRSVAERASAFNMKLIAYEKFPDQNFVDRYGIDLVDLDTLLQRSDFVTIHLPLSPETKGCINRQALQQMKPGSFLINTARGGLIVEEDLVEALRSGTLAGAGLDVTQQEPPEPDNPLLTLDNVILTPHVAGIDSQSFRDMGVSCAQSIIDLHRGKWVEEATLNGSLRADWRW